MSDILISRELAAERQLQAHGLHRELKSTLATNNQMAWKQGEILAEILDRKLYAELGCASFKSYVENECNFKLRKAHQLVALHRRFFQELEIPPAAAEELGVTRAVLLLPAITEKNCQQLIETAATMSVRELKRFLNQSDGTARGTDLAIGTPGTVGSTATAVINKSAAEHGDWTRFICLRPDPATFYVEPDVWEQMIYAAVQGQNVLLRGPSGCGKTELISYVAKAVGKPLATFNFGASSDPRAMLLGTTHLHKGRTFFTKSRFK